MRSRVWTSLAGAVGLAAALFHPAQAPAQSGFEIGRPQGEVQTPILTLDTDRLLNDSAAGRAVDRDLAEKSAALAAENRRIEAELTEEEKDLSVRRPSLTSEQFRAEAAAFDEKVTTIREEQDAKLRDLQARSEAARRSILLAANPVLASILRDTGAVAILEKGNLIVALQTIDITDTAIERLDAAMDDPAGVIPGPETEGTAPDGTEGSAPTGPTPAPNGETSSETAD